jgi:hypothetical protein
MVCVHPARTLIVHVMHGMTSACLAPCRLFMSLIRMLDENSTLTCLDSAVVACVCVCFEILVCVFVFVSVVLCLCVSGDAKDVIVFLRVAAQIQIQNTLVTQVKPATSPWNVAR